jgi:hypothetical protein
MKGWEIKPLGSVVLLALIVLIVYVGFRVMKLPRQPPPAM